jgi:hypothetical protein
LLRNFPAYAFIHAGNALIGALLLRIFKTPMDIQSFWLRAQALWAVLDQHPLLHASLGLMLLLVVARCPDGSPAS